MSFHDFFLNHQDFFPKHQFMQIMEGIGAGGNFRLVQFYKIQHFFGNYANEVSQFAYQYNCTC